MSHPVIEHGPTGDEHSAAELRSLRSLITSPTQRTVDELRAALSRLDGELHSREELTRLLVPVIADALRRNIADGNKDAASALAAVVEKALVARTAEDRAAVMRALAPTVAGALKKQHERFPEEVAEELAPIMGAAIREQVRLQRDAMIDALYPIIGSTISKYMAEALRELVDNVNRKVERTFTFKGLARRIKAQALGVSEAELLLRDAIGYSVSAAFLIHKDSGILITQAHSGHGRTFDADLVSGMLTAIRSFVNDWIARSGEASELDSIDYGRSQILLEAAGHCYLAVVVDGEPSPEFVKAMRATLSGIVSQWDKQIAAFDGNPTVISDGIQQRLQQLLEQPSLASQQHARRTSRWPLAVALLLLIGLPCGWFVYRAIQNNKAAAAVSSAVAASLPFQQSPVSVVVDGDEVVLSGVLPNLLLKDRAAEAARAVAGESQIVNAISVNESPAHEVLARAELQQMIGAFNTLNGVRVQASISGGAVKIVGLIADATKEEALLKAIQQQPGVSSMEWNIARAPDSIMHVVLFARGDTTISPNQMPAIEELRRMMAAYPALRIRIIGHNDESGSRILNLALSNGRARAVQRALLGAGVAPERMHAEGSGEPLSGLRPEDNRNRCVRFVPHSSSGLSR